MTSVSDPIRVMSLVAEHFSGSTAVSDAFFRRRADDIAAACEGMAERFRCGGRLLVAGDESQRSDVSHVIVEFLHPVVVGKRALPALTLGDISTGAAAARLLVVSRRNDMLLLLTGETLDARACALLQQAHTAGLLTMVLSGDIAWSAPQRTMSHGAASYGVETQGDQVRIDHLFAVPSGDPFIVQETHELLYHVLWELVHVFIDHGAGQAIHA